MENEVWKDIAGYEGLYQVSSLGRVKSLKFGKERILKPLLAGANYLHVNLCKNGIYKQFRVHRLVAAAFIPNPQNLPQVNHKNEDKADNHVENLEWCDAKHNVNYGTRNKRAAETRRKKVDQYTLAGEFMRTWPSMGQVARELGIAHSRVYYCCRVKRKPVGGFVWRYSMK